MLSQGLFDDHNLASMIRHNSPRTSVDAAVSLLPKLSTLQRSVFAAFEQHGAMTDRELERLPQFDTLGPSTARKRRCELVRKGLLIDSGTVRDGLKLWRLP